MKNETYSTYLFSYRHQGASWGFEVKATSMEDAKDRVRKMAYAVYDGELMMKIPAQIGFVAKAVVLIGNLFGRNQSQ